MHFLYFAVVCLCLGLATAEPFYLDTFTLDDSCTTLKPFPGSGYLTPSAVTADWYYFAYRSYSDASLDGLYRVNTALEEASLERLDAATSSFAVGNGMFVDLADKSLWTLAETSGGEVYPWYPDYDFNLTHLIPLTEFANASGEAVELSQPIQVDTTWVTTPALFTGEGELYLVANPEAYGYEDKREEMVEEEERYYSGTKGILYHISLPDGEVSVVREDAYFPGIAQTWPSGQYRGNGHAWNIGVVEMVNGEPHLLYSGGQNGLFRYSLLDEKVAPVRITTPQTKLANLGDMSRIFVDLENDRVYGGWDWGAGSLFNSVNNTHQETLWFCAATFANGEAPEESSVASGSQSESQSSNTDGSSGARLQAFW